MYVPISIYLAHPSHTQKLPVMTCITIDSRYDIPTACLSDPHCQLPTSCQGCHPCIDISVSIVLQRALTHVHAYETLDLSGRKIILDTRL